MNAHMSPVVVGVDGTEANRGALRYAVEEARRTGAKLRLVHVVPDIVPFSPMVPITPAELTEAGTTVLTRVGELVRGLAPDLEVETWLHHGTRAGELARVSETAAVLVVGRDERALLGRLVDGDTATRVAARATSPVVEVPAGWHADPVTASDRGVVVAGVKSPAHADELLGHAFQAAAARGARLVVIHAWKLPSAYDDLVESRVALGEYETRGISEMEVLVARWREAYPQVQVEIRVVHDRPAQALVAASRTADLVVIVRRARGVPAAAHLGGTARGVLRAAECPVLVAPPSRPVELPDLVIEGEGELRKRMSAQT